MTLGRSMTGKRGDTDLAFFFHAEDGIRDYKVTGVQTCALPISHSASSVVPPLKSDIMLACRNIVPLIERMPIPSTMRSVPPVPSTGSPGSARAGRVFHSDRKSVV